MKFERLRNRRNQPPDEDEGADEGGFVEDVEVVGPWVRYSVVDSQGDKHCVGGRVAGFFSTEELEVIATTAAEIDDPPAVVDLRDTVRPDNEQHAPERH